MTFQIPVGRSNHWAMGSGDSWWARSYTRFLYVLYILGSSIWPCSPRVSHSSVVRASNRYLEGYGFDSRFRFLSISTWERFFIIYSCISVWQIGLSRFCWAVFRHFFEFALFTFRTLLSTFARKFSSIDFFLKNLPLKVDELVMSEM